MEFVIREAQSEEDLLTIRTLFREYQHGLGVDLCFQGFEEELAKLPGVYSRPLGCLLLAEGPDGAPAACIALKPLEPGTCEIKRLYVRDSARGSGLGRTLVNRLLEEAKAIGYKRMKLDTLARLEPALKLYESLGFVRTQAYNVNPESDVVYMVKDLG